MNADLRIETLRRLARIGGDKSTMLAFVVELSRSGKLQELVSGIVSAPEMLAAVAASSVRHANGFDKIALTGGGGPQLRIHIWHPATKSSRPIENAHSHRWGFATAILIGSYTASTFAVEPGDSYTRHTYFPATRVADYEMKNTGTADLFLTSISTLHKGSAYWIDSSIVHRVSVPEPDGLTATVVAVEEPRLRTTDVFVPRYSNTAVVGAAPHRRISGSHLRESLEMLLDATSR
jgi:hypothetical protein